MDFLMREPAERYHALAAHYLSSHQLADFRRCPLLHFRKKQGLIVETERPAYAVGRAAHTLILEGAQAFDDEYAVGGPINPKTNAPYGAGTQAFAQWQASHGKAVLTDSQAQLVRRMADSVVAHAVASELLADGIPEGVVRADYCATPCQIRIDFYAPQQGLVDLKTCDDLGYFEADARRYQYAHQLAFYQAVLAQVTQLPSRVHLVAVEKREPFRCGVWRVSNDALALARQENEAAIRRLLNCQMTDDWPTGYEQPRVFDAA